MEDVVLEIINIIRKEKEMLPIDILNSADCLREDLGFTSFDLAELTVRIEDEFDVDIFENGLVNTVGEILTKIKVK